MEKIGSCEPLGPSTVKQNNYDFPLSGFDAVTPLVRDMCLLTKVHLFVVLYNGTHKCASAMTLVILFVYFYHRTCQNRDHFGQQTY